MPLDPVTQRAPDLLALKGRTAAPRAWQVGQVLNALATGDAADGRVTLRIGSHQVQAQTPLPIRAGQRMSLEVAQLSPQVVLRLREGDSALETVRQAVRHALPRQSALAPSVAGALSLARSAQHTALPRPVANAAEAIAQQVLPAGRVDAQTLQSAMRDSGVFLESKLAQAAGTGRSPAVGGDLKAGLLRLAAALRMTPTPQGSGNLGSGHAGSPNAASPAGSAQPGAAPANARALPPPAPPSPRGSAHPQPSARVAAPTPTAGTPSAGAPSAGMPAAVGELGGQAEAALARIQLSQLSSLPPDRLQTSASQQSGQATQHWVMELPLRVADRVDVWQLQIQREAPHRGGHGEEGEELRWSVDLAFDLAGLGPVRARVSLVGDAVSVRFWSESAATQSRFADALEQLATRLDAAGLALGALASHHGQPAPPYTDDDPARDAPWRGLLNDEV